MKSDIERLKSELEEIKTENTGAEKSKLFPTDIGMVVNDFLLQYFPDILDFHFTAKVEEEFDDIADGKLNWTRMLKDFYKPFHITVEKTIDNSERASGEKVLGIDPVSGKQVTVRIGKYGPLAQIGESSEEGEKPRFAGLRPNQRMETITLEEALTLFKLPRVVGEFEGKEIKVNIGRFGPYILHNNAFTSLKKEDDPFEVSLERCLELIEAKRKSDAEKVIKKFEENPDLQVLNGRWGPFIALGKTNFKIPKNTEPSGLSFGDIVAIIGGQDAYEQAINNSKTKATLKGKTKAKVVKMAKPAKKVAGVKKAASKKAGPKKATVKKTAKKVAKK
jgi:DNA topoisomerase-1